MDKVTIVRIHNPEKYNSYGKNYGVLQDIFEETAVINWNGNRGGVCTNVAHEDYSILPEYSWNILDGEVVIPCFGGYIHTGLKIWR